MSRVLALYDYQARKDGELSFAKGDIIALDPNNRAEARWWHGTSEANPGESGKFPANYVSALDENEETVPAFAGFAFTARSHNEISLEVGQEILVINPKPDAKWFMAESKGHRGKVPANYVTLKDEEEEPPPPVPEDEEEELPPPPAPKEAEEPPPPVARSRGKKKKERKRHEEMPPPPVSRDSSRAMRDDDAPPPAPRTPVSSDAPPPVARDEAPRPVARDEDVPPPVSRDEDAPPPVSRDEDAPPPVSRDEDVPPPVSRDEDVPPPVSRDEDVPPPVSRDEDVPPPVSRDDDAPPPVARDDDAPPPVARDDTPSRARDGSSSLAAAFGGRKSAKKRKDHSAALTVDVPPPAPVARDIPPPAVDDVPPPADEGEEVEEEYEEEEEGEGEEHGYYDEAAGDSSGPLSPYRDPAMDEEPDEIADGFMFNEPDMADTIQLNESGMLLGGPIVKTIDYITRASSFSSQSARSNALQAMAQCFRIYCSPAQFFSKVKGRFNTALDNVDTVQMNCLELLSQWVKIAFHVDLGMNKPLLEKVQDFMLSVAQANTTISAHVCEEAQKVNQLTKILGTEKMSFMDASAPLEPESYPDTPEPKPGTILTFTSVDIAQQLALVQFNIIQDISVTELLRQAWKRSDADKRAPGLLKHLHFERSKSLWLEEMVVTSKKDSERKKLMEKYSEIAEQCLAVCNYSGFVIFMRVLESPRLTKLKKLYTSKTLKRMESFRPLLDNNLKEIRSLQDSRTPSIPYVKLWMNDMTKLEQGNPDYLEGTKLINWRKVQLLGMFLRRPQDLLRCGGYKNLTVKPPVVAFIHSMQPSMNAEQIESHVQALLK